MKQIESFGGVTIIRYGVYDEDMDLQLVTVWKRLPDKKIVAYFPKDWVPTDYFIRYPHLCFLNRRKMELVENPDYNESKDLLFERWKTQKESFLELLHGGNLTGNPNPCGYLALLKLHKRLRILRRRRFRRVCHLAHQISDVLMEKLHDDAVKAFKPVTDVTLRAYVNIDLRFLVLSRLLFEFEEYGRALFISESTFEASQHDVEQYFAGSRIIEYLEAVWKVNQIGKSLENQTQWASAIAHRMGTSPTAPLNIFRNWGLIKPNERKNDFLVYRARIEAEAKRLHENGYF